MYSSYPEIRANCDLAIKMGVSGLLFFYVYIWKEGLLKLKLSLLVFQTQLSPCFQTTTSSPCLTSSSTP